MKKIILATQSKYKIKEFKRLNIDFEAVDSYFDEGPLKDQISDPLKLSQTLASEKAKSLLAKYPQHLIISSDQVMHLNGKNFSKPGSFDNAFKQLQMMRNKTHELITSFSLQAKNVNITKSSIIKLTMKNLSNDQIKNYLNLDKPFNCTGSYKLESFGITLMSKVAGDDQSSIIGIPLLMVSSELSQLSIFPFE